MRAAVAFALLGSLLAGHGKSEGQVQREWQRYLRTVNACSEDQDCVVINLPCPLPCWSAVRRTKEKQATEKAQRLVRAYNKGGPGCVYDCELPSSPRCEKKKCTLPPPLPL
jgi:hypothetical protein